MGSSQNFNPRAPCGARRHDDSRRRILLLISIHAPLVGRDLAKLTPGRAEKYFNPRAPCGARQLVHKCPINVPQFQSTRPLWGATRFVCDCCHDLTFQSTRPLWGATRLAAWLQHVLEEFQSTRPLWGATAENMKRSKTIIFQSTRPLWGATFPVIATIVRSTNFNPRAPCGARQRKSGISYFFATISNHAPLVGRDCRAAAHTAKEN